MIREEFCVAYDVSREAIEKLDLYVSLLQKWSKAINLLGPIETDYLWHRHIADCAQIVPLIPESSQRMLDIGSGAGLPGLVVAILTGERLPSLEITLIEADKKKAAFLREASRQTGARVKIVDERTEDAALDTANVIAARAFAPLPRLFRHAHPFTSPSSILLLHKGKQVNQEIDEALSAWKFDVKKHPSQTDPDGIILEVSGLVPMK